MADAYYKWNPQWLNRVAAPVGTTNVRLSDGWIVWVGEEGTFLTDHQSAQMTQDEIDEYNRRVGAKAEMALSELAGKDYAWVDTYINANVTDFAGAKTYLKKLSKVVLALVKFSELE